jgi:predicted permease
MSIQPDSIPPTGLDHRKKSPALALLLAFLPSAMILAILPFARNTNPSTALLIAGFVISVVCCFTSSFMLFRRGTGLAIFGGIIFLLLNGVVSFFFGCGAILTQMKF